MSVLKALTDIITNIPACPVGLTISDKACLDLQNYCYSIWNITHFVLNNDPLLAVDFIEMYIFSLILDVTSSCQYSTDDRS